MATIHFTGTHYDGSDGATHLSFTQPGDYEVPAERADQLTADFPQQFSMVTPAEAPIADEKQEKVSEVSPSEKADEKAAEKPAKKK